MRRRQPWVLLATVEGWIRDVEKIEDVDCANLYCPNCFDRCELQVRYRYCMFVRRVLHALLETV